MKAILVPTDFSKISRNALKYAAEIAIRSKAKIILFHTYYIPIITSDVMVIPPIDVIENSSMDALKKMEKRVLSQYGKKIKIEFVCKYGFPIQEINTFTEENNIDLIVIGKQGTGFISEKIIGSVTTSLIRKSTCPILVVGKQHKFKPLKKIVLATDFETLPNIKILNPLKEIATLFKSHIHILNIVQKLKEVPLISKAEQSISFNNEFKDIKHSFYLSENKNVVSGINQFIKEKKIDITVMIPRKHFFLESMFNEPHTKRIAFHTTVPLLSLHE